MARKYSPQPRGEKKRRPVSSAFLQELDKAVKKEMDLWGVSRSFVIANAVGFALNVKEQPTYRVQKPHRLLRRVV